MDVPGYLIDPIRTRQMNQPGNASSSEPTQTEQINQTETPPPTEHIQTETDDVTWKSDSVRPSVAPDSEALTFWTACPYCYILYEYPKVYEDCTLRCQAKNCRRAFHAVVVPLPPVDGEETYISTLGFFPLGYSGNGENTGSNFPSWPPVSTMFALPNNNNPGKQSTTEKSSPRLFYDEDDVYIEISSDDNNYDDDDWQNERRKKKANNAKGSVARYVGHAKVDHEGNPRGVSTVPEGMPETAELSKRGKNNLGKLDLNVELSKEVEEPFQRDRIGYREEDNVEGNEFFEDVDEFLSSLHMLGTIKSGLH